MRWVVGALLLVLMVPGCFAPDEDYRAEGVKAIGWLNGDYHYYDVMTAFQALGLPTSDERRPNASARNATMALEAMQNSAMDERLHPNTWTLVAFYEWRPDVGRRAWRDDADTARQDAGPLRDVARWHFDAFLRELSAEGDGAWDGTADRDINVQLETRKDYTEPADGEP